MSLNLSHIKKSYGDHIILDFDHFKFERGAHWIQGGNGEGKTTLLKLIAGMLPFNGEVTFNNLDLRKNRQHYLQQVSYAAAEPLYPEFLSGKELIDFYGECRNAKEDDITELLAVTGVKNFAEGKVGSYSSGMVKKLSLLLAFVGKPSVILLDEPLITIDKDSVHFIYDLMHAFVDQQEGILLFTTHHAPLDQFLLPIVKVNLANSKLEMQ